MFDANKILGSLMESGMARSGQSRSDILLQKTEARLEDVQREIDGLKLKRKDVETSIEATIQTLRRRLSASK